MHKILRLSVLALAMFCVPVRADALFDGLLRLASAGDAEAQYHIGMMYNNGIGVAENHREAFEWFKKAAQNGDPLGAYKVGCYYAGQFEDAGEPDAAKALEFKMIAAKAGYALAQNDVATHYGQAGDRPEAEKWLLMAAHQGDGQAMLTLFKITWSGWKAAPDHGAGLAYFDLGMKLAGQEEAEATREIRKKFEAEANADDKEKAAKIVRNWKFEPSPLTLQAKEGLDRAKTHLAEAGAAKS